MPACPRCGTEIAEEGTQCPRCRGAAADEDAPLGTWSSSAESEFPAPEGEAGVGEPSTPGEGRGPLRVHRGGASGPPGPKPIRPSPDVAPIPSSSLAVAPRQDALAADETSARRRLSEQARPAEVVRLHPALEPREARDPAPDEEPAPPGNAAQPRAEEAAPTESADASQTGMRRREAPEPPEPQRVAPVTPPFLASQLLREDVEPAQPARDAIRTLGVAVGLSGALVSILLGGLAPLSLLVVAVFAAMAAAAAVRVGYETRAGTLAGLSLLGIGISDWPRLMAGAGPEELLLSVGTLLLASFLLLRAYHRVSRLARRGVAISLVAMVLWLAVTAREGGPSLSFESFHEWTYASFRVGLVMLLFLSLFAFMGPGTKGGCNLWAYGLIALYAIHTLVHEAELVTGAQDGGVLPDPTAAALLLGASSLWIGAIALAQLFAAARLRGLSATPTPEPTRRAHA